MDHTAAQVRGRCCHSTWGGGGGKVAVVTVVAAVVFVGAVAVAVARGLALRPFSVSSRAICSPGRGPLARPASTRKGLCSRRIPTPNWTPSGSRYGERRLGGPRIAGRGTPGREPNRVVGMRCHYTNVPVEN